MEKAGDQSGKILIFAVVFFVISLLTTLIVAGLYLNKNIGKTCNFNGEIYNNGEGFYDGCNSCSCTNGEISCTAMACDNSEFDDIEDESFYEDEFNFDEENALQCVQDDVIYEDGEEFANADGSLTCACLGGEIVCEDLD